jgi:bifunctional non-homologous end joining protein LigD
LRGLENLHLARTDPATFLGFDVLHVNGRDLRRLPLEARKRVLRGVLPRRSVRLRYVDDVRGDGAAFFRLVCDRGLEGIVAKLVAAPMSMGQRRRGSRCGARRARRLGVE